MWLLASLFPALFVLCFFALTFLSAPEHDDFCFAYLNARQGILQTIATFYHSQSGRITALFLSQLPPAISGAMRIDLLSAYALTMALHAVLFLLAIVLATARTWPRAGIIQLAFLSLAFTATVIGASPSVRDLLYWLSGVTCYVPPAVLSILILGECVRALDSETEFSLRSTVGMAAAGLVAAMFNEFTGLWLLLIIAVSVAARHRFSQHRQLAYHGVIATAVVIGWLIVVSASGNSQRMAQLPTAGHVIYSLYEALRFSINGLFRLLRESPVIAWLGVTALMATAEPEPTAARSRNGAMLALGIAVVCLACCYFEYFTHQFATGMRLVERAQNEALILLLFALTLSVRLLAASYRPQVRQWLASRGASTLLGPVAMPACLAVLVIVSLGLSSNASLLRSEGPSLYPYWRESVERHILLSETGETVVRVPRHKWTPSLLMSSEVTSDPDRLPNDCIARYYRKSAVYAGD